MNTHTHTHAHAHTHTHTHPHPHTHTQNKTKTRKKKLKKYRCQPETFEEKCFVIQQVCQREGSPIVLLPVGVTPLKGFSEELQRLLGKVDWTGAFDIHCPGCLTLYGARRENIRSKERKRSASNAVSVDSLPHMAIKRHLSVGLSGFVFLSKMPVFFFFLLFFSFFFGISTFVARA